MLRLSELARRGRPSGSQDLLLRVGLAPEAEAKRAWREWSDVRDFEHVSHAEQRLLAAFSERIARLDPSSPLTPRVDGLAKRLWTKASLTIVETTRAFDKLAQAKVRFLVFKGGATLAEGFATARRRMIDDIDILVHPEAAGAAVDALIDDGWCSVNGESPAYLRRLARTRISGNYRKGHHGALDLHISPFHFARMDEELDRRLWSDARISTLAGRDVLIPDPANAIVISLAHAPISANVEWALDVMTRIAHQPVDWDKVVYISRNRGLTPSCLSGLQYLHDVLSAPVPDSALTALRAAKVPFGSRLKFWSNVSERSNRNLIEKVANRYADRLLRREGYMVFVKDRAEVALARPSMVPPRFWVSRKGIPVSASQANLGHEFVIAGNNVGRWLIIKLAVPRPSKSRRLFFDVTANGIAIARLRCRLGPPQRAEKLLTFVVPVPDNAGADIRIAIESRPAGYLPPGANQADRAERGAIPFRLLAASVR